METYLCRTEGFLAWSAWSCSLPVSFCHKVMFSCRIAYDTCLVHYSFLFQEVFIVMAEQSGWCFVVGKSTVCRWKVSSFSRGFCAPGAHGFLDFFVSEGAEAREEDARGMFRASTGDSRCRVLQNVTEAWATTLLVFAGLEEQSGTGGVFARRKLSDNGIRERT